MKFLVALLFAATSVAVAQEALCTTAVGVSNANTACDEHIKDELTAFGTYAYKKECPTSAAAAASSSTGGDRRQLRGSEGDRKLYCSATLKNYCATSNNGYSFCWTNSDCTARRRLAQDKEGEVQGQEKEQHEEDNQRELQEEVPDPLLGANWQSCKMRFGEFNTDVEELLMKYEINPNKAACWKYVWCRVRDSELALELENQDL